MPRAIPLVFLVGVGVGSLCAQEVAGVQIHGFVTQGFLFSSQNNYLSMKSSEGSPRWTDGAVSFTDSVTNHLRVGVQLHAYQLGEFGSAKPRLDWALGDYRVNDRFGFRAGKVKKPLGLFNDSQDVDTIFLWILLPQSIYPSDNKSFFLSHLGGEVYGDLGLGSHAGTLRYRGYAGQSTLDLKGGYLKVIADGGLVFTAPPGGTTYGGDLRWETPLRGLGVGSSAHLQEVDGAAPAGKLHAASYLVSAYYAQFHRGRFYFAGEYRRLPFKATVTIWVGSDSNSSGLALLVRDGQLSAGQKVPRGGLLRPLGE